MDFSSYNELLLQVATLKTENSNLRRELADNSNHLSILENEASNMKEVLSHFQNTMDGRTDGLVTDCDTDGTPDNRDINSYNGCDNEIQSVDNASIQSQLIQLERERSRILQDIDIEEKEKQWFLTCLERINQQLNQLSRNNGYSDRNDDSQRRQLERDAECIRSAMQQKLGTRGEMLRREEARNRSICLLEKQIERLCQHDDQDNVHSKLNHLDDEMSTSKMTTSAMQTMDMYLSDSISPPPPPGGDLGNFASMYHGTWPVEKDAVLWHSSPSSVGGTNSIHSFHNQDAGCVANFRSNIGAASFRNRTHNQQQLGTKVEMVYSLLSMLGSHDKDDMSRKLLSMSSSVDSCIAMRQSGCLPLLIELLHGDDKDMERQRPPRETRRRASQALHNIVHSHPDDKRGRREARVLRLLEQIRDYCNKLRDSDSGSDEEQQSPEAANGDQHPVPAMAMLMKLSFDEEHRHAMCQLGGLQAIAELVQVDYETHGNMNDQCCITLRRYAGMALTNLTFGDGTNKALLCSIRSFMRALVAQLHSPSEDLRQVTASVLRNLSWRADQASKKTLREVGAVATLMKASMEAKKESTLKSILSALWNLSAHCSMNKADICAVEGALAFLVGTLTYKSPSKTHAIIENGGGILRNISSHVAVREDYRTTLRKHNCLQILLQHLRSPSLTIVSNACGTLWNLSARCAEDQQTLWDMGAVGMLRNLVHSKHKMISMGSSAALKNLLSAKPRGMAAAAEKNKSVVPSLLVRKQKALEAELDQNLAETCENLDSPKTSPTHHRVTESESVSSGFKNGSARHSVCGGQGINPSSTMTTAARLPSHERQPIVGPYQLHGRMYHSVGGHLPLSKHVLRSDSKESIVSTRSDSSHDRLRNLNILLMNRQAYGIGEEGSFFITSNLSAPPAVLESRIQYVMQEVTRQIALENIEVKQKDGRSYLKSAASSNTSESGESGKHDRNEEKTSINSRSALFEKYSNLTSMIENLNLDDEGDNDQPVNYSLKYSEEAGQHLESTKIVADGMNEARLMPKVDNCGVSNNKVLLLRGKDVNRNELSSAASTVGAPTSASKNLEARKPAKQTNIEWEQQNTSSPGTASKTAKYKLNTDQGNHKSPAYSHYAETDLDDPADQPTNYSLRYTEDTDTTDNFCPPAPQDEQPYYARDYQGKGPSVHDDTLRTYCTEGTPLNFSTATSMTDLREVKDNFSGCAEEEEEEATQADNSKIEGNSLRLPEDVKDGEKSVEGNGGMDETGSSVSKPVTYCVEDTPPRYSHVSSVSSIHSNEVDDDDAFDKATEPKIKVVISKSCLPVPNKKFPSKVHQASHDETKHKDSELNVGVSHDEPKNRPCVPSQREDQQKTSNLQEGKTVTFGEDHYAEETPLMFSRCSSLGSLSSFDQHSIHDDRSSVISDFSRRASEVVSPSDLPDSPGQTRPPSPRGTIAMQPHHQSNAVTFTSNPLSSGTAIPRPQTAVASKINSSADVLKTSSLAKPLPEPQSVFEDSSRLFAEEGTPLQFSHATSLSSLPCFDDDPTAEKEAIIVADSEELADKRQTGVESHDNQRHSSPDSAHSADFEGIDKRSPGDSQEDDHDKAEEDEEEGIRSADYSEGEGEDEQNDEDILAACINSAMPNNTRHNKQHKHNNTKLYSKLNVLGSTTSKCMRSSGSGIPIKSNNLRGGYGNLSLQDFSAGSAGVAMAATTVKSSNLGYQITDKGSTSSKNSECNSSIKDSNSDTSSVFDDVDNDKMLAQCIQSGMPPKGPRTSTSSLININSKQTHRAVAGSGSFKDRNKVDDLDASKQCYHKSPFSPHFSSTPAKVLNSSPVSSLRDGGHMINEDILTTYSVEGTPANFSAGTSLSDLTIDSNLDDNAERRNCHIWDGGANDKNSYNSDKEDHEKFPPDMVKKTELPKSTNTSYKFRQNFSVSHNMDNAIQKQQHHDLDEDVAKTYAVEGTPWCLSRGSSLSSLNGSHTGEESGAINRFDVRHQTQIPSEQQIKFQVEDTPVCFSRNSSLSSLSVESLGVEPTPSEQALLDECISSGMPKSRRMSDSERKSGRSRSGVSRLPCAAYQGGAARDIGKLVHGSGGKMASIVETGASVSSLDEEASSAIDEAKNGRNAAVTVVAAAATVPSTIDKAASTILDSSEAKDTTIATTERMMNVAEAEPEKNSPEEDDEVPESLLIELEATKLAEAMELSQPSQSSDLIDNVHPPSVIGDVTTSAGTLSSSGENGISESQTAAPVSSVSGTRRGSLVDGKLQSNKTRTSVTQGSSRTCRNVPELVLRALADGTTASKPPTPSKSGSMDNLCSSRSNSTAGDLIDNMVPPSLMEDADMTSSTYSVCSIVSEVADPKSSDCSSFSSDVAFKCMKPVLALAAEMYAGNFNSGLRSQQLSLSEIIENVDPPSMFLQLTDNYLNECTEVATDTLENNNDTDVEDDLPPDPVPVTEQRNSVTKQRHNNENVTLLHTLVDHEGFEITPEEVLELSKDANLVLSTLNEIQFQDLAGEDSATEDMLIECETLSLVSNDDESDCGDASDCSGSSESPDRSCGTPRADYTPTITTNRRPRIVKPINRDTIRQQTQKEEEPKRVGIRGRRKALYPRPQVMSSLLGSGGNNRSASLTPKVKEMTVKPTRTSALRATQSQQKVQAGVGVQQQDGGGLKRTPPMLQKSYSIPTHNNSVPKIRPRNIQRGRTEIIESRVKTPTNDEGSPRPKPPVKQGTFTKDKPSQICHPKISPTKTRIPTANSSSLSPPGNNAEIPKLDERPPRSIQPSNKSKLGPSKSLDDGTGSSNSSPSTSSPKTTVRNLATADPCKTFSRRGQSSSPVSRGFNTKPTPAIRTSPSSHSLEGGKRGATTSPLSKVNCVSGGSLSSAKRSSSNASLCSNSSSSTTNSKKGLMGKKEVRSKVAALWKSDGKLNGRGDSSTPNSVSSTPKEGMSRSSTYEKIGPSLIKIGADGGVTPTTIFPPCLDVDADTDTAAYGNSAARGAADIRAVAEARLRKWTARKARIMAKKVSQQQNQDNTESGPDEQEPPSSIEEDLSQKSMDDVNTVAQQQHAVLPDCKALPAAAIVPPFNYTPSSQIPVPASRSTPSSKSLQQQHHQRSFIPTLSNAAIVRPRESSNIGEKIGESGSGKHPCMVTTV